MHHHRTRTVHAHFFGGQFCQYHRRRKQFHIMTCNYVQHTVWLVFSREQIFAKRFRFQKFSRFNFCGLLSRSVKLGPAGYNLIAVRLKAERMSIIAVYKKKIISLFQCGGESSPVPRTFVTSALSTLRCCLVRAVCAYVAFRFPR